LITREDIFEIHISHGTGNTLFNSQGNTQHEGWRTIRGVSCAVIPRAVVAYSGGAGSTRIPDNLINSAHTKYWSLSPNI
jgi:hypothetical protein